jgi:serine/threonine protein phosphatase PrpC
MKIKGWAVTDVGRKRDHNEDSFLCSDELHLYAVADGMGGHLGGERASRMAVEILEREVGKAVKGGVVPPVNGAGAGTGTGTGTGSSSGSGAGAAGEVAGRALRDAIGFAAHADAQHAGMGTTLTGAFFHGAHVTLCHVGDSRAYLYRDGRARQLTEDHSWIQEQVRAGLLSPDDALVSRFRNIITRSVGFEPRVEPDVLTMAVEAGDCFLLCSDGLSNYLSPDEIGHALTSRFYGEVGSTLVQLANERGGDDNITCVVIYVANAVDDAADPAAR